MATDQLVEASMVSVRQLEREGLVENALASNGLVETELVEELPERALSAGGSEKGINEVDECVDSVAIRNGLVKCTASMNASNELLSNMNEAQATSMTDASLLASTYVDGSAKGIDNPDGSVKGDTGIYATLAPQSAENSLTEPVAGMTFHSEEEAYNFYNSYAKRRGFSVRKGHLSRRRDNSIRDRHYVCSNEGTRQEHHTHVTKKPRPLERTNCLARIEFKVNRSNAWVVNKFIDNHNHPLANPNEIHLLRSHKKKHPVERAILTEADYYYGAKPAHMHDNQVEEAHENVDASLALLNYSTCLSYKRIRDLEKGDAQFLLEFLKTKKSEDPLFFYAVQIDEKQRLTNFFWADGRSIVDYAYFGDAVTFETTYRINRFDVPFAPFIGVNHHKQILIFGAALLLDETLETFIWLFKTFLTAMSGKQPKTIFTDRCDALSKAISITLPNTSHQFCLWHILQNVTRYVHNVSNRESNFQKDFENCLFECGSKEDFQKEWDNVISKHCLESSLWLKDLYAAREKWCLAYIISFSAIMTSKQWIESLESLFKIYFYRKLPFAKFTMQYFKSLAKFREKELLEDYESCQNKPAPLVDIPMLSEAAESYTKTMYMDFEYEYKSQLACLCEPVSINGSFYTYRVSVPQKLSSRLVDFNPSHVTVTCSCKKFETMGVLCIHALKVLNNNNVLYLPAQYIIKRWTKYAKDGPIFNGIEPMPESSGQVALTSRYGQVCRKALAIAVKSTVSKDALVTLEHGLDRFLSEMENMFHGAPCNYKQIDENAVDDDIHQNALEASSICFDGFEFSAR